MKRLIPSLAVLALAASAAVAESPRASLRYQDGAGEPPHADVPAVQGGAGLHFLEKNSRWWSAGVSYADDYDNLTEVNLYGSYSRFIEDRVEIIGELSVRYFDQDGGDALGVNPAIVFRYHWWSSDEVGTWTAYADIGIGAMIATDDVPQDGTSFDFTPRAGVGITHALSGTTRLLVGLRWSHISNARLWGDNDNPGSDAAMLHVGIIWEF